MDQTTDFGRAYCIRRLSSATTLDGLKIVWGNLGDHYRRDAEVLACKDKLKLRMK